MERETWARLEDLFFRALQLDGQARAAWLDEVCRDDPASRREIEALLAAHAEAGGILDFEPVPGEPAIPPAATGRQIGAWTLGPLIGRGGMGEVYRARRSDGHYDQEAAVKLVRAGRDAAELMRRFRTERQILARLQHPNIATLLDGGVSADGQPYLVMQYVAGTPITKYAHEKRLGLPARLELFRTVCRAVQFAHANLVVHRDLKPTNILVTEDGEVRLLDFGIAKLLDSDGVPAATAATEDLLLLTPEHAAPEQFLGGPITTATDVHALGILLYELLTGFRPFQFVSAVELGRAVCEREVRAPSEATVDPELRSRAGGLPCPVPASRIAGDLDCIVLKALRKEPERRYASASDLADDVQRHMAGYPVQARPETFGYVAARFLRRHRNGVLASAGLAATLVALAVVSVRFALTSRAQAAAITRERDVAVQVSTFLENLFAASDPFEASPVRRDTLRIRDFLDEGARKVRAELGGQPVIKARMFTVLGKAYRNTGEFDKARPLLEEALEIRRRELAPGSADLVEGETILGLLLLDLGENQAAESLFREAEAGLASDSAERRFERASVIGALGNSLQAQGRFADAETAYRQSLGLMEAAYGPEDSRVAESASNLATILVRQERLDEAEPLLRKALALWRAELGNDHPDVATGANNLANLLQSQGRLDEAETLIRESLAIRQARFRGPHPLTARSINNLANILLAKGDLTGAEALFRESLDMRIALFGRRHPDTGLALINLAAVIQRSGGNAPESVRLYDEARSVLGATLGTDHPLIGSIEGNLGSLYHGQNDHITALRHLEAALRIRRAKLAADHPQVAATLMDLGRCLTALRRYPEAEARLLEASGLLEPRKSEQAKSWDLVLERLSILYRAMDRPADAERYEALRVAR